MLWSKAGLLIDCFKTIEYFRFRFCFQNHCIFSFRLLFQKNLKLIVFPIVCDADTESYHNYRDKQEITSQCLLTTITHYTQVIINNLPPLQNNCCALSSLKNDQFEKILSISSLLSSIIIGLIFGISGTLL